MSSFNASIADAVCASLNAGTFSMPFTAKRIYVPVLDLQTLDTLAVLVMARLPDGNKRTQIARSLKKLEVQIDIAICQRIPDGTDYTSESGNAALDPLLQLAEEIADSFGPGNAGSTCAMWVGTDHNPTYDPGQIEAERVFFSLVTVTYRIIKP